jgi:NTP pyrophosphatase (non-canonical NTP hydrolase)
MRIAAVMQEVREINAAHGFHAAGREVFAEKLMLVVTELAEAMEEFRDGRELHAVRYEHSASGSKPEGIPIELADAVIRIFDLCKANSIDLESAIRHKLDFNKNRPYKHNRLL